MVSEVWKDFILEKAAATAKNEDVSSKGAFIPTDDPCGKP